MILEETPHTRNAFYPLSVNLCEAHALLIRRCYKFKYLCIGYTVFANLSPPKNNILKEKPTYLIFYG